MLNVGVILSGCGPRDGSEIHEAVLAMLALEDAGATVHCIAPVKPQAKVVDHSTGETIAGETRNVLCEAARLARGNIKDLAQISPSDLDALILPGGYGAALNLCDFVLRGEAMTVDPEVANVLIGMHEMRKPIGAICIAPVILAKLFGQQGAKLTIGNDKTTADKLRLMGATHVDCAVSDCVIDEKNLLVTTPAYMCEASIKDVNKGIKRLVHEVVQLAEKKKK